MRGSNKCIRYAYRYKNTYYDLHSSMFKNQKKDIEKFNTNHKLNVYKSKNVHDRYIIIDNEIYILGGSIKDIGKKPSYLIQNKTLTKENIIKYIM